MTETQLDYATALRAQVEERCRHHQRVLDYGVALHEAGHAVAAIARLQSPIP